MTEAPNDSRPVPPGDSSVQRPRPSRAPVAVLIVGLALAALLVLYGARLAATPASPPDLSRPGTRAEPRPVNVILRDYSFDPTPVRLVAGETVRFNVVNGGLVDHEFVLGDRAVQEAWAAAHAAATPVAAFAPPPPASVVPDLAGLRLLLGSGASEVVDYEVPHDVALELFCHLPGHAEQGMVGRVVIAGRD